MEQPPPTTAPPPTSAAPPPVANHSFPDSIDSSPPSRNADSWDDTLQKPAAAAAKLRLMCSYGGHIVPRPHDKSLCYVAGETRIVVADRSSNLADLSTRLSKTLLGGGSFTLKYQLPNEDLDSLISVTTDEDLENMIEEYDRLAAAAANCTARKSSRLRLFLFPTKPDSGSSIGSLLDNSTKTEDWFLNALNGSARGFSESSSVNCLLGLDDAVAGNENSTVKDESKTLTNSNGNKQGVQDVHSVPDSPMLENSSSFGSTSSCPSLANLPPIRVHSEDQKPSVGGIEEQLSQMSVGTTVQKQEDGNFLVVASPPPLLTAPASGVAAFPGEYTNQLVGFSDDDRSDQGLPIGYRKPPQPQQYTQQLPPSSQPKPSAGFDLASQDSVSSDNSATNPLSHQRTMVYQDQTVQNPSGNPNLNDPNPRVQVQQVQETGYVLQNHFDQQNQQQFNPQQQQQQQFIQVPAHYMHPHQAGAIPMGGYFLYPPHPQQQQQQQQQQHQQQLYYVSARPAQGYNMPIQQQQNYVESAPTPTIVSSRPQPPAPTSVAVPNHEMVYRTETGATTRLMQVSPPGQHQHQHQQQFVGYPHQIHHHPSQSMAPPPPPHSAASAAATSTANYAYEYADPALSQMYYSQHMSQQQQPMAAPQYQTVTSPSAGMVAAQETSSQVPAENTKPPQK